VKIGQYLAKIWTKYDSLLFGPPCRLVGKMGFQLRSELLATATATRPTPRRGTNRQPHTSKAWYE